MSIHIDLDDSPGGRSQTRSPKGFPGDSSADEQGHTPDRRQLRKRRAKKAPTPPAELFMHQTTVSRSAHIAPSTDISPRRRSVKADTGSETERDKAVLAGRRLYANALTTRSNLEQARNQHQAALEKEITSHTFHPTVSRYTQELVEHSFYKPPHQRFDPEQHMEDRRRLRREHERLSAEEEAFRRCTFRPEVNDVSKRLVEAKFASSEGEGGDPFARLHRASEKDKRLEALRDELTSGVDGSFVGSSRVSQRHAAAHADKLHQWAMRREEALERLRGEMTSSHTARIPRDQEDAIVRRLRGSSEVRSVGAGEELPAGRGTAHRAESIRREHMREETHQPKVSAVSSHLASLAKYARYENTFKRFAGGPGGPTATDGGLTSISVEHIRGMVRNVYTDDNGILAVFVHDPDTRQYSMGEFSKALARFEHQYGPQKWGRGDHGSTGLYRRRDTGPEYSFKPTISEGSQRIATTKREHSQPQPRVSRGAEESSGGAVKAKRTDRTTHDRLYALGRAQQLQRTASEDRRRATVTHGPLPPECTFAPTISKRSRELSQKQLVSVALDGFHNSNRRTPQREGVALPQRAEAASGVGCLHSPDTYAAVSPLTDEEGRRGAAADVIPQPEVMPLSITVEPPMMGRPEGLNSTAAGDTFATFSSSAHDLVSNTHLHVGLPLRSAQGVLQRSKWGGDNGSLCAHSETDAILSEIESALQTRRAVKGSILPAPPQHRDPADISTIYGGSLNTSLLLSDAAAGRRTPPRSHEGASDGMTYITEMAAELALAAYRTAGAAQAATSRPGTKGGGRIIGRRQ